MRRLPTVQIIKAWIDRDLHDDDRAAQTLLDVLTLQEKQMTGDILQDNIDSGTSLVETGTEGLTIRIGLSGRALK